MSTSLTFSPAATAPRGIRASSTRPRARGVCVASAAGSAASGQGKVAVITGANTGLGKVSATDLALQGYTVVLACRSRERAENAAESIRAEVEAAGKAASLDVIDLDLGDLASVSDFASTYKTKYDQCDVLLNNAGVMAPPTRELTKDGFELQIGVNHLGHFALTAGLMEPLLASPSARVVNLASIAHEFGKMSFDDLNAAGFFRYSFLGWGAYGQSKLANVLFTYELHRKLRFAAVDSICTNAVHPGVVDTELSRMLPEPFKSVFDSSTLLKPEEGARGQIRVASSAEFDGVSGKYISELAREGRKGEHEQRRSSDASYNMEDASLLWDMSAELTGAKFDFTRAK